MRLRAAAALLVLACASSAHAAQPDCEQAGTCARSLTGAQLMALAERLLAAGRTNEAQTLLIALTDDAAAPLRRVARYRLGLIHVSQKDYEAAARLFRSILDEEPNSAPVRLEFARTLALMGDREGAARQLRAVQALPLPPEVAKLVDRVGSGLRDRSKSGGSIEFSIAPDSNINRATSAATVTGVPGEFVLDEDARSKSGIGLSVDARGFVRLAASSEAPILVEASASGDVYREGQFNDVSLTLTAGPELRIGKAGFRPALVVSRHWFGGDVLFDQLGAEANFRVLVKGKASVRVVASVADLHYRRDFQSGPVAALRTSYERAFSPSLFGRVALGISSRTANERAYSTFTWGGDVLVSRDFGGGTIFGGAELAFTTAEKPIAFFGERRDDQYLQVYGGLSLRSIDVFGLSPVVRVRWSKNASPVPIYDFERTRLEVGLIRAF